MRMSAVVLAILCLWCFCGCGKPSDDSSLPDPDQGIKTTEELVSEPISLRLESAGSEQIPIGGEIGRKNYLCVQYSAGVGVKVTMHYRDSSSPDKTASEVFYLEGAKNGEFRLYIGQEEKQAGIEMSERTVTGLTVENLQKESGRFQISSCSFTEKPLPTGFRYLENENLKFGVNLSWGGGICFLSYRKQKVQQVKVGGEVQIGIDYADLPGAELQYEGDVNLLNHHDVGRLIQQSYYGSILPPYEPGEYLGNIVPYNPVQGGDTGENESKIVDFQEKDGMIYVKCQPRDWAPCQQTPSYMENWYTLEDDYVRVKNRFVDFSNYIPQMRDQELPAIYTARCLERWVVYEGDRPFTGGELQAYIAGEGAENKVTSSLLTENWVALLNADDFGVGVYVPDLSSAIATNFGSKAAEQDPQSPYYEQEAALLNATSYTTMIRQIAFRTLDPLEYEYYITAGNIADMRDRFYALHEAGAENQKLLEYTEEG